MRADEGAARPRGAGDACAQGGWEASLELSLRQDRGGTMLARAAHRGPLRVQRPFYPEGAGGACHVYVLHPPGGVVSGDRLRIDARLSRDARALLTAPGASKLYRARDEQTSTVTQRFTVDRGAVCEWLPPETIVYDGARACVRTEVALDEGATYAGWDVLCLGRPAAGERFTRGALRTELALRRAGKLCYLERGLYRGGDTLLTAPWGLGGAPVLGLFVVASPAVDDGWVERLREALAALALDERDAFAATSVSGVLVLRYLGASTRVARLLFERAFDVLRPLYAGRAAVHPRIWST